MPAAMLCLFAAIAWLKVFHPVSVMGQSVSDGLRGLLFGLSIDMNLFAAPAKSRRRREAGDCPE